MGTNLIIKAEKEQHFPFQGILQAGFFEIFAGFQVEFVKYPPVN